MIVVDEAGYSWSVVSGDPGYAAAYACVKAGIKEPVLPRAVILGRDDPDLPQRPDILLSTGEAFLHRCRLEDCLAVIARSAV